jgi:uncharacterized membrane protein YkoI
MKPSTKLFAALLAVGIAAAAGGTFARAATEEGNDATTHLESARISLTQAIAAAEAVTGGKATRAVLDADSGAVVFEVEVASADRRVVEVKVDALRGKILSSRDDPIDRGEADEEE